MMFKSIVLLFSLLGTFGKFPYYISELNSFEYEKTWLLTIVEKFLIFIYLFYLPVLFICSIYLFYLELLVRSDTHTSTLSRSTYASSSRSTSTTPSTLAWSWNVSGPSSWTRMWSWSAASRVSATVSTSTTLCSHHRPCQVKCSATRPYQQACSPTFAWTRCPSRAWALSGLRREPLTGSAVRTPWKHLI